MGPCLWKLSATKTLHLESVGGHLVAFKTTKHADSCTIAVIWIMLVCANSIDAGKASQLFSWGGLTGYHCPHCWPSPLTQAWRHLHWGHIWLQFIDNYYGFRLKRGKENRKHKQLWRSNPATILSNNGLILLFPAHCFKTRDIFVGSFRISV